MSSIAIGDIHGNVQALDDLLSQVEPIAGAGDTVVFLGDYIDRGAHSRQCVDRILRFREETVAEVVTLLGNHEDWMLRTLENHHVHSWLLAMDVYPTIESYSPEAARTLRAAAESNRSAVYGGEARLPYDAFFDAMPEAHLEFFRTLGLFHATQDAVFAHAGLEIGARNLGDQPRFALLMGTFEFVDGYRGPPPVVYGHRNNADVREGWPHPRMQDWTIGLDTISHGVLTAVRLPDRTVFQSGRYRDS